MSNQIFKKPVSNAIMFEMLEKVCIKTDKYYLFDLNAYRKLLYYGHYAEFAAKIVDYYHISKQKYVSRKLSYNSITNIIRQICKSNNVLHTSQMKYDKSSYNIDYYVYFSQ